MTGGPTDIAEAPGPEVCPAVPDRRAAYTDFERDDEGVPSRWPGQVSVSRARLDGLPVDLVELDSRAALPAREFVAAVDRWENVDDHDHVLPVVASGKQPRPWFAVPATESYAERRPLSLAEALWVGVCLADALAYAHDWGLTHGALSPARVAHQPTADWGFPRLGGFAVADALATDEEPSYRAPEQLAPDRFGPPGPLVDVHGLGVTLYELLTGEPPYAGPDAARDVVESLPVPPSTLRPDLPGSVDDLLRPALATAPADRYDSVAAFRDELVSLLEAEHVSSPDGGESEVPVEFPLFDGDRAEWTAPCPDCGRSVTNTFESFRDHWRDAARCEGPSETVPNRATCSAEAWERVVEATERAIAEAPEEGREDRSDHPLWAALAAEQVTAVGGVDVASPDGSYPWLSYPRRGWRVPCPACGSAVYNTRSAMKAHWSDAPACGPPDAFSTR